MTRASGRPAHLLWCGPGRPGGAAGLGFTALGDLKITETERVPNVNGPSPADRSERVRRALERLHREHRFDRIEFPVHRGLGFRSIQAKRAGLAFEDVCLAVTFDSCSQRLREQAHRWPSCPEDLELDFAERYSFEEADAQECPCPDLLDYARSIGWAVRPDGLRPAAPEDADAPLATVSVAHYNLGRFLPDALASLAAQTYPNLEVLVIDDGSTDPHSIAVFEEMRSRYPGWRFLRQPNSGIGATRNRGLWEAKGEYFLPVDADNTARPDMVERFVTAAGRNRGLSALTCYFLAFPDGEPIPPRRYTYACRPTGGPHTLACIRNVYGDANALFRTDDFRAVGGYETDRDTSYEDWEAFVKLVHAGRRIGVVPEYLFDYRHRTSGFSRVTDAYRNQRRVLRQFMRLDRLPPAEQAVLWTALFGFQQRAEELANRRRSLRRRLGDCLFNVCARIPWATRGFERLLRSGWFGRTRLD